MAFKSFEPVELTEMLGAFPGGVNGDIPPLLLPKDQLSAAYNITVRGLYARPRPPFQKRELSAAGKVLVASALSVGPFQGAVYYNPDTGDEVLLAALGGRLFRFDIQTDPVSVTEITFVSGPNPSTPDQAWLWQAEKWIIWNDGQSNPVIYDGSTAFRSAYGSRVTFPTTSVTGTYAVVPAVGAAVTLTVGSNVNMLAGDILTFASKGTFLVQNVNADTITITIVNVTGVVGSALTVGTVVTWSRTSSDLPPGRMGVYGMGRNWICLTDGKQFIASDLVGGSSGTVANNYRDSVLKITENLFLAGGGNFAVPGSIGDIRAMVFASNLDVSLGQGPLMIFTHSNVFSCQTPVDRLTWQDLTSPILTQSLIGNGALGQNSTVTANSDILFRSIEGIRSLILARREFNTWGNVPISAEVSDILLQDSVDLLRFGSAIVWDNRHLLTARPAISSTNKGIYHRALIALNFDPISSLRGKQPSVYDGVWTGLNVLQLVTGEFRETPRAFAFGLNLTDDTLELYELAKAEEPSKDNGTTDIQMEIQSAALFNYPDGQGPYREYKRLLDGEIYVDKIPAGVIASFQAYWKPDGFPCWQPWSSWQECAGHGNSLEKPQFRPRMGLGEPNATFCDETTNRPLREGYTFQFRLIFTNCRFLGARFRAITIPQPAFAPQTCLPQCPSNSL